MDQQTQKVALPTFLRKRLRVFRVGKGEEQYYLITNFDGSKSYRFEPWQFYILEILPGCENFQELQSIFEDRFGRRLAIEDVNEVFTLVAKHKLFGLAATSHPLVMKFKENRLKQNATSEQLEITQQHSGTKQNDEADEKSIEIDVASLPAGIQDAIGFDERTKKGWKLFNPSWIIKKIYPLCVPLKYLIYVIPTLLIAGLFIAFNNFPLLQQEIVRLFESLSFIEHVLFGMLTVNLAATLTTALVAYSFRASVIGFCIVFHFGFFPRFMVRLSHVKQLTRRERLWLHAAPILTRTGLLGTGVILWFIALNNFTNVASFALSIASMSFISLLITVNPLIKSNGYHWIAAYVNEPFLKGKALKALLNKIKGDEYRGSDDNILIAYALASTLFVLIFLTIVIFGIAHIMRMQFGGAGILLTAIIVFFIIKKLIVKMKQLAQAYERSVQFERWKKRTLPQEESQQSKARPKNFLMSFTKTALVVLFVALMFIPYPFEPGGGFTILPLQRQEIVADISGIVKSVYFNGGEFVEEGTLIGQLEHSEYSAQEKIYAARILEQEAYIAELKSKPRPEEVELASKALEVEQTRVKFSEAKVFRLEKLYKERATSFEELDDARREYRVDLDQVEEKLANLKLVKLGASSDQIVAAEAKLKSLEEERNYYLDIIERSKLYMPFDGTIVGTHLQQKKGSFLEKGEPFAIVENTEQVLAEIEIPEPDIGYIEKNAQTVIRPNAISGKEFYGTVSTIAPNVEQQRFGKIIRVVTEFENSDGLMKTGMTGYAKIEGGTLPVWQAFSLAIVRFFKVEVWSWIP